MYTIVQAPNEILRTSAKPVVLFDSKLQKTIQDMTQTMLSQDDPEGVGLAANQVDLPWQIFVARFGTKKTDKVRAFINPEILSASKDLQPKSDDDKSPLEGCLSKPGYYGIVKRAIWINLKFQDEAGASHEEKFEGFPATVIQHEMDHLSGIIFIQRILEQKGRLYKITKNGKNKDIWDEVDI